MTHLLVDRSAFTRAVLAPDSSGDAASEHPDRTPDPRHEITSLEGSASRPPAKTNSPALSKGLTSDTTTVLAEQRADLQLINSIEMHQLIRNACVALTIFASSATFCLLAARNFQTLSLGQGLAGFAGGIGTFLSGVCIVGNVLPDIFDYFKYRKERQPEHVTSKEFIAAEKAHLAAHDDITRMSAVGDYAKVMSEADPPLQVKCAYRIMDLVSSFANPIDRASAVVTLCANADKALNSSIILERAAREISVSASAWILDSLPSKRIENARWVERCCKKAFPRVSAESEEVAQDLLRTSGELHDFPTSRHVLLRTAFALADPDLVTKGTVEEHLIGNAEYLNGKLKLDALKQISRLKGVSKGGQEAIAGQLEQLLPALTDKDASAANRLIRDLAPNSSAMDDRARQRLSSRR